MDGDCPPAHFQWLLVGKETSSKKIGLAMIFTRLAYNSGFYSMGSGESLKISH